MRRFITLVVAAFVGITSAQLRLGDYCATNELCNSGCCSVGVCRISFEGCGHDINDVTEHYLDELREQNANVLASKIISFAKNVKKQSLKNVRTEFQSLLVRDFENFAAASAASVEVAATPSIEDIRANLRPLFALDIQRRLTMLQSVSNETTPVVANETTPVVTNETTPVVANETTPVVANETTPVVANETTPVVANETVVPADNTTHANGTANNGTATNGTTDVDPVVPVTPVEPEIQSSSTWTWILVFTGLALAAGGLYFLKKKRDEKLSKDLGDYSKVQGETTV